MAVPPVLIGLGWRPERSQRERTRREDRRLKFYELRDMLVNGAPGAEWLDPEGRVIGVMSIEIAGGRIQAMRSVVNPDKLEHLGPLADVNALLPGLRGIEAGS